MAENKKYYWIKLKTDFFNQATIDFMLSQKNGCEYIVLYQMLCLNTANTGGEMCAKIGEMIVPYDVDKIVRDTKYFDFDTVTIALSLFKKLGLIYEGDNNMLCISNYDEMVGCETPVAKRVREHRARKALQCNKNVTQEIDIRDKILEIDKDIDKDKENEEKSNVTDNITVQKNIDKELAFEEFWREYPKKQGKKDAQKAFSKLKLNKELFEKIMQAIKTQKNNSDWVKENGKYIPLPATWIRGERWEDEIIQTFTNSQIAENYLSALYQQETQAENNNLIGDKHYD